MAFKGGEDGNDRDFQNLKCTAEVRDHFSSQHSHTEGCVLHSGISLVFNAEFHFSKRKGTKSRFSYKKACGVANVERGKEPEPWEGCLSRSHSGIHGITHDSLVWKGLEGSPRGLGPWHFFPTTLTVGHGGQAWLSQEPLVFA